MRIKVRLNKVTKVEIIGIDAQEARQFLRDLGVTFDTPPPFTAEEQAGIDAIGRFCEQNPSGADDDAQEVGVNGGIPAWWGTAKESPPDPVKAGAFSPARPTGPTEDEKDALERAGTALNPPAGLRGWVSIEEDIAAAGKKAFADLPLAAKLAMENQLRTEGIIQANPPTPQATPFDELADQVWNGRVQANPPNNQQRAQEVQLAYNLKNTLSVMRTQDSLEYFAQATQLAQGEAKTEPRPSSPQEPAIEPPAKAEAPSGASLKVPAGVIISCRGNRWTWRCTVPAWVGSSTQKWPTRGAARQDAIRWLESDPPLADKSGSYNPDVFDRTREREKWPDGFKLYFESGEWIWMGPDDWYGPPFPTYRAALDNLLEAAAKPPAPVELPPPMAAMLPGAKAKEEAALVAPKEAFYTHPGAGWGPFEDGGLVKHLVCNGKGCTGCDRQGCKRCQEKPKRAFKRF